MTDVFISYKRRLRPRVEEIAAAMRSLKLDVWFDAALEAGSSFSAEISTEVRSAKCVLVCWSPDAFPSGGDESGWVLGEAQIGRTRKVLVPVILESVELDPPWNTIHTEDLSSWQPSDPSSDRRSWQSVLNTIARHTGRPGLAALDAALADGRAPSLRAWRDAYPEDPMAEQVGRQIEAIDAANRAYEEDLGFDAGQTSPPAHFVSAVKDAIWTTASLEEVHDQAEPPEPDSVPSEESHEESLPRRRESPAEGLGGAATHRISAVVAVLSAAALILTGIGWWYFATPQKGQPEPPDQGQLEPPTPMNGLYEAARAEGQLNIFTQLPNSLCGSGTVIDAFKAKYPGIVVSEMSSDAVSEDEIDAIKAGIGHGSLAPDVVDLRSIFVLAGKAEGLYQPYRVSTWGRIPDDARDPEGYWSAAYFAAMSFIVNTDIISEVPTSFADLLLPEYANSVALYGDPRGSFEAISTIFAAGLATNGGDRATAADNGLEFFARLNANGNLIQDIGDYGLFAKGKTPIIAAWDYNTLLWRDILQHTPNTEVVVPADAVGTHLFAQAISAYAPHPNAAKLWMEYLYSDEGQLQRLSGYCHPIRLNDLAARNLIPTGLASKAPDPSIYAAAVFPTPDEQFDYYGTISTGWDSVVGVDVAK